MDFDLTKQPWIGRTIEVADSTDPTLIGINGIVQDETRRTVVLQTGTGSKILAKDTIVFKIGDVVIDGSFVKYRPEERISKRLRRRLNA